MVQDIPTDPEGPPDDSPGAPLPKGKKGPSAPKPPKAPVAPKMKAPKAPKPGKITAHGSKGHGAKPQAIFKPKGPVTGVKHKPKMGRGR